MTMTSLYPLCPLSSAYWSTQKNLLQTKGLNALKDTTAHPIPLYLILNKLLLGFHQSHPLTTL